MIFWMKFLHLFVTPLIIADFQGAPDGRSLKKRSVGCNPDEVLVEAITKVPFGEQDVNEKTDRAIRAKVRRALVITLLSILSCVRSND